MYINKKTNEFKLVQILNKYFPDILLETLSECANEIMQAGYVQLQAGEDGLVSCLEMSKIYQQNKNACDSGMLVAMQVAAKAQKALDDNRAKKEKRELVNILKDLVDSDDCVLDHHGYCQSHGWLNNSECPHARAKKTLEELK